MQRKFSLAIAAMITCLFAWSPVVGQSMPKEKQAELAFEIRLDQLRGTPLYKALADNIEQMQGQVSSDFDIEKVTRMWGAIQFPESIADMQAMDNMKPGDPFPMEMFVHIEFADAASADAALATIAEQSDEVTVGGTTFLKPKDGTETPSNMLGHKLNPTTIEAGTEGYLTGGAGKEVFSSGLGEAWDSFGEEPIRLAFDMENARGMISEGLNAAKADAPPMFHPLLDSVANANNVRICMDLEDGGNLLKICMLGVDDESAEQLRSGLDGILGMAKMAGGGAVEQMRAQSEEMADVASAILRSLAATREGNDVQIVIPKPDGFEDAIKGMMEMNGMGSDF